VRERLQRKQTKMADHAEQLKETARLKEAGREETLALKARQQLEATEMLEAARCVGCHVPTSRRARGRCDWDSLLCGVCFCPDIEERNDPLVQGAEGGHEREQERGAAESAAARGGAASPQARGARRRCAAAAARAGVRVGAQERGLRCAADYRGLMTVGGGGVGGVLRGRA
jgi:hypothetical protein